MDIEVLYAPDEPILTNILLKGRDVIASTISSALSTVEREQMEMRATEAGEQETRAGAIPPWQTLSEQFDILAPVLRDRCLQIADERINFSLTIAQSCRQPGPQNNIMPGCLPMANACAGSPFQPPDDSRCL